MNLGIPEILMIFGVALLFFGPKKLPELGRSLGRGIVEFRKASSEIRENFVHHLSEADQPHEAATASETASASTATAAHEHDSTHVATAAKS